MKLINYVKTNNRILLVAVPFVLVFLYQVVQYAIAHWSFILNELSR